jgi:hypothetical protein
MNQFEKLTALLALSEADFVKFYDNNNNAAGTRVRQKMMELKNLAQEIRLSVTEKKASK